MIGTSKIGQTQQLHISDPICLFISFISYALEYDHLYLKKKTLETIQSGWFIAP